LGNHLMKVIRTNKIRAFWSGSWRIIPASPMRIKNHTCSNKYQASTQEPISQAKHETVAKQNAEQEPAGALAHEQGLNRKNHCTGRPDRTAAGGNGCPAHAARDSGAEMKSEGRQHRRLRKRELGNANRGHEPRPETGGRRLRKTYTNNSSRRKMKPCWARTHATRSSTLLSNEQKSRSLLLSEDWSLETQKSAD
jgi:hypothetical protein